MNYREKLQKFSIRKYTVGAFSTVIATLIFLGSPQAHASEQLQKDGQVIQAKARDQEQTSNETSNKQVQSNTEPKASPVSESQKGNNETLNKVMFDKAKDMTPKEAGTYSFRKSIEQFHYKHAGTSNLSVAVPIMLEKYPNGVDTTPEKSKLSHQEAFNMLLFMVNSSKKGMDRTQGELQDTHEKYFNEYTDLLDMYRNELKRTLTGSI